MRLATEHYDGHITSVVGIINERGLQNFVHSLHIDQPTVASSVFSYATSTIVVWKFESYPDYLHFCKKINDCYGFERCKPWPEEDFFANKNLSIAQGF